MKKYSSPRALAGAPKRDLKNLLRPLGMEHKRADLLKKLGKEIVEMHGGCVPGRVDELLELPGLGRYATNAVLCLAHGERMPMVDTNVVRVIVRVFGFKSERVRLKDDSALWTFVESLLPLGVTRNFNLALLDFAAKVCTARNPKCKECVVCDMCQTSPYLGQGKKHEVGMEKSV